MFNPGTRVRIKDKKDLAFINKYALISGGSDVTIKTVFIINDQQYYNDGSVISVEGGPTNICWTYHREFKLVINKNLIGGKLL